MRTKIEQGQYVDLEHLLQKTRAQVMNDEQCIILFIRMAPPTGYLQTEKVRLMVSGNGTRHSESMQLFIVGQIQKGQLRSGNIFTS